ncbi:hypothetical protein [Mesorhizobium sp. M0959]|uniref:hypothetical protein n=1 Tax=unclassified Mesorhizobium TaxID=325217 RepID=UPI003337F075
MERELPKQVFIDGCEQISMEFEPIGFRFAKSGPHASRRAGDWAFKISFQSNYLNVGGEYVELVVHAFRSERDVPTLPDRLALGSDTNNLARVARAMKIGLSL